MNFKLPGAEHYPNPPANVALWKSSGVSWEGFQAPPKSKSYCRISISKQWKRRGLWHQIAVSVCKALTKSFTLSRINLLLCPL